MSTVEYNYGSNGFEVPIPHGSNSKITPGRKFHRIRDVCIQQGATARSLSRKMDLTAREIREQEDPHADLKISDLLRWQQVLEVPLADLLVDNDGPLSDPVGRRASMVRVMKTAKAILESSNERPVQRLASMLVTQLIQVMPELAEVAPWHTVGQRRTQTELGRIVDRTIPDNFFNDPNRGM